jgi:hypothetical protein
MGGAARACKRGKESLGPQCKIGRRGHSHMTNTWFHTCPDGPYRNASQPYGLGVLRASIHAVGSPCSRRQPLGSHHPNTTEPTGRHLVCCVRRCRARDAVKLHEAGGVPGAADDAQLPEALRADAHPPSEQHPRALSIRNSRSHAFFWLKCCSLFGHRGSAIIIVTQLRPWARAGWANVQLEL